MARNKVDPAIKAAALADLHNGDQPIDVAERYGLDAGKVRMWKTRYVAPVANLVANIDPSSVVAVTTHREAMHYQQLELGELVMLNLRAKLIAAQRIADYASTSSWLDKQNASDVAELFEVLDRTAVNILDRLAAARHERADDLGSGDAT